MQREEQFGIQNFKIRRGGQVQFSSEERSREHGCMLTWTWASGEHTKTSVCNFCVFFGDIVDNPIPLLSIKPTFWILFSSSALCLYARASLWLWSPLSTLPQKCLKFNVDAPIWLSKQRILCTLNQSLKDVLNYGLFQPAYNGKAGKFLDEERQLREYPFPSLAPVPYLEVGLDRVFVCVRERDFTEGCWLPGRRWCWVPPTIKLFHVFFLNYLFFVGNTDINKTE